MIKMKHHCLVSQNGYKRILGSLEMWGLEGNTQSAQKVKRFSPKNEIKESVDDEIDVLHPTRVETTPTLVFWGWWQSGVDHL